MFASPSSAQVKRAIMEGTAATSNTIFVDTANVRVGIGTAAPTFRLDVQGDIRSTGTIYGNGSALIGLPITSTAALSARIEAVAVSTGSLYLSTASLTGSINAIGYSTGTISNRVGVLEGNVSTTVFTTSSYSDPAWITKLSTSKIDLSTVTTELSGKLSNTATVPAGLINLSTVTTRFLSNENRIGVLEGNVSTTVFTTGSYANPSWITSLATSKIDLSTVTAAIAAAQPVGAAYLSSTQTFTGENTFSKLVSGSVSGNAGTSTALAADPADCILPNVALGINASGSASCSQPSNVTGSAATITGNIATSQISAGDLPTNVLTTAIKTGSYVNDVRVSSANYATYAVAAGALTGGAMLAANQTFTGVNTFTSSASFTNALGANSINSQTVYLKQLDGVTDHVGLTFVPDNPSGTGTLAFSNTSSANIWRLVSGNQTTDPLYLYKNSGTAAVFEQGGDVGLGVASPLYNLDVANGIHSASSVTADAGFYGSGAGLTALPAAQISAGFLGGSVVASSMAVNSVYANAIPDSSILFSKWASNSCGEGYVPAYRLGVWACEAVSGGGGGGKEYYFSTDQSDVSPYKVMYSSFQAQALTTYSATVTSGDVTISTFITLSGYPTSRTLPDFQWETYFHGIRLSGSGSSRFFAEVFKRTSGGTETIIGTSELSDLITNTESDYRLHFTTGVVILAAGDRIVTRIRVRYVSGSSSVFAIRIQGTLGSHQMLPTQPLDPNTFISTGAAFAGDVTGTYLTTVVGDNSHAHNTTTLSGVITSTDAIITLINGKENADVTIVKEADLTANDFNVAANVVSLDYTNGQAASAGSKGFLTSTDWSTFNGKQAAGAYLTAPVALSNVTGVAASTDTVPMSRLVGALSSTTTVPAGLINLSTVTSDINTRVLRAGDTMTGQLTLSDGSTLTVRGSEFSVGGTTLAVNNGKMQIGNVSGSIPNYYPFLTAYESTTGNRARILLQDLTLASGKAIGLYFLRGSGSDPMGGDATASIDSIYRGGYSSLRLNVNSDGSTPVEAVTVIPDGKVGISTTVPTHTLSVYGDINYSGNLYKNGVAATFGGGATGSTVTVAMASGGDVFVASGTFIPNIGMHHVVDWSSVTVTGVKCYTLYTSTTNSTYFNIARSTDTGNFSGWGYMFSNRIEVSTNTKYSAWATPTSFAQEDAPPVGWAVHVTGVPSTGTLPQEYGCIVRYWRKL